jgi:hypothetical protein
MRTHTHTHTCVQSIPPLCSIPFHAVPFQTWHVMTCHETTRQDILVSYIAVQCCTVHYPLDCTALQYITEIDTYTHTQTKASKQRSTRSLSLFWVTVSSYLTAVRYRVQAKAGMVFWVSHNENETLPFYSPWLRKGFHICKGVNNQLWNHRPLSMSDYWDGCKVLFKV